MKEPVRIVSDIHLGHPMSFVQRCEALRPLIHGATTMVFNGDTVEMRFPGERERALDNAKRLCALCTEEGCLPILLNGNHDPDVAPVDHLDFGPVFIMHGDAIFDSISPWSPKAGVLENAYARERAAIDPLDLAQHLAAAKRAARAVAIQRPARRSGLHGRLRGILGELWPPRRPLRILKVWWQTPEIAAAFAREFRPAAKFVIIGHVHASGIREVGGVRIINTGSFLPAPGRRCVDIENGLLRVRRVERARRHFRAGAELACFELGCG